MKSPDFSPDAARQSNSLLLIRAVRLRCPACGRSKLFRKMFSMNDACPECGRKYDRAPGYLLGSIYFNYGITALLIVVLYFGLYLLTDMTGKQLLGISAALALFFPLWFFRYARALWVAMDERFDPWPNEQEARMLARKKADV